MTFQEYKKQHKKAVKAFKELKEIKRQLSDIYNRLYDMENVMSIDDTRQAQTAVADANDIVHDRLVKELIKLKNLKLPVSRIS